MTNGRKFLTVVLGILVFGGLMGIRPELPSELMRAVTATLAFCILGMTLGVLIWRR